MRISAFFTLTVLVLSTTVFAVPILPPADWGITTSVLKNRGVTTNVLEALEIKAPARGGVGPTLIQIVPPAVTILLKLAIGDPLDTQAVIAVAALVGKAGTLLVQEWWTSNIVEKSLAKVITKASKKALRSISQPEDALAYVAEDLEDPMISTAIPTYFEDIDKAKAVKEWETGRPAEGQIFEEQQVFTAELLYQLSRQWTDGERETVSNGLEQLADIGKLSGKEADGLISSIWDAALDEGM